MRPQKEAISMTKTMQTGKVGKLNNGSYFTYGGVEWGKLDEIGIGALATAITSLMNVKIDAEGARLEDKARRVLE